MTKKCIICGKDFIPNSNRQKRCKDCRILKCAYCGKPFTSPASNYKQKYCSQRCSALSHSQTSSQTIRKYRKDRPRNRKISKCLICGKEFEHWAGRKAKYCSRECWNKRNPKVLEECLYCGKEFWSYKRENRKYCSKKCDGLHRRILKQGENTHLWRGGKTKKSKLLRCRVEYREWRNAVFQRDDYTCQGKNHPLDLPRKCGEGIKVYLHAHHIKSVSEYPELIYEVNNGITLCKNCHLLEHNHKF